MDHGWLPPPEVELCACGATAYRQSELAVAESVALARAARRRGIATVLCLAPALGLVLGLAVPFGEPIYTPLTVLLTALGMGIGVERLWRRRIGAGERLMLDAVAARLPRRRITSQLWFWVMVALFPIYLLGRAHMDGWALVPAKLWHGEQLWRLASATVMHGSLLHLIGNSFGLWLFSPAVEARVGKWGWLTVVAVTALAGHLAFAAASSRTAIGISGAVYGLAGAMIVLLPRRPMLVRLMGSPFAAPAWVVFCLQLGIFTFVDVIVRANVAWQAHVAGFAAGALVGLVLRQIPPSPRFIAEEAERAERVASAVRSG